MVSTSPASPGLPSCFLIKGTDGDGVAGVVPEGTAGTSVVRVTFSLEGDPDLTDPDQGWPKTSFLVNETS